MSETQKAKKRREREGFFKKYCRGRGIDIGCGNDILKTDQFKLNILPYDRRYQSGNATFMKGLPSRSFNYVHSSHCLEHIQDLKTCIKNWWRLLKPGGYLLLLLPERDLYEKKKKLPSKWNQGHKHFFLLERDEKPNTIGIVPFLGKQLQTFGEYRFLSARTLQERVSPPDKRGHSVGEYSIEIIVKKIK